MIWRKEFYHTNSSDDYETVVEIRSSEEEKKRILYVAILKEVNEGELVFKWQNTEIGKTYTGQTTIQNMLKYDINLDLPVGEKFLLKLKNISSGSNAKIVGFIAYELIT